VREENRERGVGGEMRIERDRRRRRQGERGE